MLVHARNNWWKYLVALALIALAIFVWPIPQIRENRAEKVQVAEAGCTANGVEDPNGNPVVFADGEQLPDSNWVCEAESPNGPYNWVRKEEEAVAEEPAPEPETPAGESGEDVEPALAGDRITKLIELDETYRSQGWEAWLRAAGITFDSTKVESRQPLEEVLSGHMTVTGLVIRATGLEVSWPSCITTDRPNEVTTSASTRQHQPDLRNPSVLYTNAVLNGQATVYADCSDWGQLDPTE